MGRLRLTVQCATTRRDGHVVLVVQVFVNNAATEVTVTCDAACFKALADISGIATATGYTATDLWGKKDTQVKGDTFSATVPGDGGSSIFKLVAK